MNNKPSTIENKQRNPLLLFAICQIPAFFVWGMLIIQLYRWNIAGRMGTSSPSDSLQISLMYLALAGLISSSLGLLFGYWLVYRAYVRPLRMAASMLSASNNINDDEEWLIKLPYEISFIFGRIIEAERHLKHIETLMEQFAEGEFKNILDNFDDATDEGKTIQKTVNWIRGLIQQLGEHAHALLNASQNLADIATQSGEATTEISRTIQQIALGVAQQAEAFNRANTGVERMGQAMSLLQEGIQDQSHCVSASLQLTDQLQEMTQKVLETSRMVFEQNASATTKANQGTLSIEESIRNMQLIQSRVSLVDEKIQEMGKRSSEIGLIVDTIREISAQTNLLALNAAIEAARAGQHGKGFAVVADEVRKLAEKAANATKDINALIQRIQSSIGEARDAMDAGSSAVENGVILSNQAGQVLMDIVDSTEEANASAIQSVDFAEKMNQIVEEMVTATRQIAVISQSNVENIEHMASNTAEFHQLIEDIASVSEENSAAIEEVSASSMELSHQAEEVASSAAALNALSLALSTTLEQHSQNSDRGRSKQTLEEDVIGGAGLIYRRDFVLNNYGTSAWQDVLNSLTLQSKEIMSQPISPNQLYPQSVFSELIQAIQKSLGNGNAQTLGRKMSQFVAQAEARGIYRYILRTDSVEKTLSNMPILWKMQIPDGDMSVNTPEPHKIIVQFRNRVDPELCQNSMIGYFEGLLMLHQIQNGKVNHTDCIHRGQSECRYLITW